MPLILSDEARMVRETPRLQAQANGALESLLVAYVAPWRCGELRLTGYGRSSGQWPSRVQTTSARDVGDATAIRAKSSDSCCNS